MKNKRSVVFFLFLFVMCVFLCNSQELEAKNNTKKSVQVTKKERCITVGDSYKIKLKKAKGYTFTSSDKTIATVSKKGTIKAKNKGKCTITASNNKNKYVYKITTERRIGGYIAVLSGRSEERRVGKEC